MTLHEIYALPVKERTKYLPVKYRKYFWTGWYIRSEWRYNCSLCRRKGLTENGFRNHLANAHNFGYAGAGYLITDARHDPKLDEKRISIGCLNFTVLDECEAQHKKV